MRLLKVTQFDQGHRVSFSVLDSGFKFRLPVLEPCFANHARRMSGRWLGGLGSDKEPGAFRGEEMQAQGHRETESWGHLRTQRGCVARVLRVRGER